MNDKKVPRLIVNFKTYEKATGKNALKLAKTIEKVSNESGELIGICINPLDLSKITENIKIPVYCQYADSYDFGAHTGAILPAMIKLYGASGVLLNHAEKPLNMTVLKETVKACKSAGLASLVCFESLEEALEFKKLKADMLLIEHCDSMGSCVSISEFAPEMIEEASKIFGSQNFMIGAGINKEKDIEIALAKGAYGVILSNSVVNSEDPEKKLLALLKAFV